MWDLLLLFTDQREYFIRFGSVMCFPIMSMRLTCTLLYLCLIKSEAEILRANGSSLGDFEYFSHFPEETMRYLHESAMEDQTFYKVLQKIIESRFTDAKTREEIHALQR